MAGINPVIDPLLGELVSGPEAGPNVIIDGFEVGVIGETGSGLYNAGDGIDIEGATISVSDRLKPAAVSELITGGTRMVDVTALRGALSAGQAVDVTSAPDDVTDDYRGTFSVTGSLGFASFPKFKSGLTYLMIADLTATTSGTVTPSGTWLDGTAAARSLAAGTSARVAMLFNASNKGKLTFSNTGSVSVSNCREYEVTSCTSEARAYIASLSDPDAFAAYYLVAADMVNPWNAIIDMGTSSAVTVASGLSYKLNASTGVHQLTVDTCPAGYNGRDAVIRITLGGSGVIQAVAPLQLGDALTPYAINNCIVQYRDGEAVLKVTDILAGYVVTVSGGTDSGSLFYGLSVSDAEYISFSPSTDGTVIDLGGVTTYAGEKAVVGNGYEETTLTGAVDCGTSKFTVANLTLSNVGITGGTMTLGDAYVPSGSIVTVASGATARVERTTLDGVVSGGVSVAPGGHLVGSGTIDFGGSAYFAGISAAVISGVSIFNGGGSSVDLNAGLAILRGGAMFSDVFISGCMGRKGGVFNVSSGALSNCIISGCSNDGMGGAVFLEEANTTADIVGCTITGCTAGYSWDGGGIAVLGANTTVDITSSLISGNIVRSGTNVKEDVWLYGSASASANISGSTIGVIRGGFCTLSGKNRIDRIRLGTTTLASGAILDLTENSNPTPVESGGGVIIDSDVQIYPSAGSASAVEISGGTYTAITNGGVLMGPVSLPVGGTISGNATIDVNGKNRMPFNSTTFEGVTITGYTNNDNFADAVIYANATAADVTLNSCIISGNRGGAYCAVDVTKGTVRMSRCVVSGNTTTNTSTGGAVACTSSGTLILKDCNVRDSIFLNSNTTNGLYVRGSNALGGVTYGTTGKMFIEGGAIVNLTGNTNTTPISAGSIVVSEGCTVINSAGASVNIARGTYTQINNDGTTVPAQE